MNQLPQSLLPTPALSSALRRSFAQDTQERLTALYRWVAERGGLIEQAPRRTPHTSFNPRPARLALIALKELSDTTETEVAALLLTTLTASQPIAPPGLEAALALSTQIHRSLTSVPQRPAASLAACITLDSIRHLHLSEQPNPSALLGHASQIATQISTEPRAIRLSQLLHHAITQQTALLQAKSET